MGRIRLEMCFAWCPREYLLKMWIFFVYVGSMSKRLYVRI
jgi:hypothetical protein